MRIVGSSLHLALGKTAPLDYDMIKEAVDARLREDQQLDWKEAVGNAQDVAADVAAMANTRGGMLIYGVKEDRTTSAASEICHVAITDAAIRAFRSKLYARMNPTVAGLMIECFPPSATEGLLVVQIPESPDAPHVVGTKKSLGVPYRVGTQTEWMSEWEIERAYRDRIARRVTDSAHLDELIEHLNDYLDVSRGCWIVGATRLTVPISSSVEPPNREAAMQTALEADRLSRRMFQSSGQGRPLAMALDALRNPRVGLRRWVVRDRTKDGADSPSDYIHLELHHDGSIVLAERVEGWYRTPSGEKHYLPAELVAGFCMDFTALVGVLASRQPAGQTLIRLRLVSGDDQPFAILIPETIGGYQLPPTQPGWSTDVRRFLAVDHALANRPQMGRDEHLDELRTMAQTLAADVVSQFGLPADHLQWPDPSPT